MTKENLTVLYKMMVQECLMAEDQAIFYKFLKDFLYLGPIEEHVTSAEDINDFFTNIICDPKNDYQHLPIEGLSAIESLLITVNKHFGKIVEIGKSKRQKYWQGGPSAGQGYATSWDNYEEEIDFRVKTLPSQIFGANVLWKVALEAKNETVISKAIELLNKLYTKLAEELEERIAEISTNFVETAIEKMKVFYDRTVNGKENRTGEIIKMLRLIEEMIDESERRGNGGVTPLLCLYKGFPIKIHVLNLACDPVLNPGIPDKFDLNIHSRLTYWQLRMLIANKLKIQPEVIRVMLTGTDPKEKDNGKTMEQIHILDGDTIKALKRTEEFVSRVDLLKGKQLTEKAKGAFSEIFDRFSKDGHMTRMDLASFTSICLCKRKFNIF